MIIVTERFDFNSQLISAVDRVYEPGIEHVIYIHLHGAGIRLSGDDARSFLGQWGAYKILHNERFQNECQQAAGL